MGAVSMSAVSISRASAHRVISYFAAVVLALGGVLGGVVGPAERAEAHGGPPSGSIPDAAFLQPEEIGGTGHPIGDFAPHLRPPLPCGSCRYASMALRRAEGSVLIDYPTADFHTVVIEHIVQFRGQRAAARYLRELRQALGGRGCTDSDGRWTVRRTGVAGRGSLLIRLRQRLEDPSGQPVTRDAYLIVARVGRAVVVLTDIGWELGSGDPAVVRGLIGPALRRARAVR